jgi:hypothetical protein
MMRETLYKTYLIFGLSPVRPVKSFNFAQKERPPQLAVSPKSNRGFCNVAAIAPDLSFVECFTDFSLERFRNQSHGLLGECCQRFCLLRHRRHLLPGMIS